jgi:hypothetical protein
LRFGGRGGRSQWEFLLFRRRHKREVSGNRSADDGGDIASRITAGVRFEAGVVSICDIDSDFAVKDFFHRDFGFLEKLFTGENGFFAIKYKGIYLGIGIGIGIGFFLLLRGFRFALFCFRWCF